METAGETKNATFATPMAPLRVLKTAEVVADHIRRRIIRGELKEGDYLPPEGQLMASLSISRPTLREAFRILEAERLISVVRGSRTGARIHQPQTDSVSRHAGYVLQAQGTTIADIYKARLAIEPAVAGMLAAERPEGAVEKLRASADELSQIYDEERYVDFMLGLSRFHQALVEVSGNKTLLFVTQMLHDLVDRYQVKYFAANYMGDAEARKRTSAGVRSFRKLIDLIEAGDAVGAETHWRLHLVNANKHWTQGRDGMKVVDVYD